MRMHGMENFTIGVDLTSAATKWRNWRRAWQKWFKPWTSRIWSRSDDYWSATFG